MKHKTLLEISLTLSLAGLLVGCGAKAQTEPTAGAPPPTQVEKETNGEDFNVDHPEQFALAIAGEHAATPELNVTGAVSVDVSRAVPVVSIASGRIVEIHARVGDTVKKGQLLLKVQSADISQAFSDYRQAVVDEALAKAQLERSKLLYEKGAVAQKDLEVAQDVEAKAVVTVENTLARLKVLGAEPKNPTAAVDIFAPASGVITDQQVTAASGTQGLASPNLMTISDLSHVWIVCDVYEDKLSFVRQGEFAEIHLNAYPNMVLKGRISNIGAILDPSLRTAKVRIEVRNAGILRLGMFVTATFHGQQSVARATVPSTAILHLHDRDWVYVPKEGGGQFQRVEVSGGNMLGGGLQEVIGIPPGRQIVQNALALQATVGQ